MAIWNTIVVQFRMLVQHSVFGVSRAFLSEGQLLSVKLSFDSVSESLADFLVSEYTFYYILSF